MAELPRLDTSSPLAGCQPLDRDPEAGQFLPEQPVLAAQLGQALLGRAAARPRPVPLLRLAADEVAADAPVACLRSEPR